MKRITFFVVAVFSMFASGTSFADASSSATVGPLKVELFDLTPGGEGASWITFADLPGSSVSTTARDFCCAYDSDRASGTGPWSSVAVTSSIPGTTVTAKVESAGVLTAAGTTSGSYRVGDRADFSATALAPYEFNGAPFTLSPFTLVVFSATSSLSTTVTRTFDLALSYEFESAVAQAALSVSGPGASGSGSQSSYVLRSVSAESTMTPDPSGAYGYIYTGMSASETTTLAGSFVNFTAEPMDGYMYALADVYGSSFAHAVPEPSTYALLIVGIGVVGFMARPKRLS